MVNKRFTLSRDGKDLGDLPWLEGNDWDYIWGTLTAAAKATGKTGRWYLYMESDWWDDPETHQFETRKLEHFIEFH